MRNITCSHLLTGANAPVSSSQTLSIDGGKVAAIGASPPTADDTFVMPSLINAHDHGRAVRVSSVGGSGKPLETWLNYLALFPSVDPYLASVVSLSHSALGGAGTVMMHYTRTQGFTDLPTEAKEVARAARDVGVKVGFAISMKDRNPLVYGPSEPILAALPADMRGEIEATYLRTPLTPAQFIALVDAVADATASPTFNVQYGPNGVQWCTTALLEAVADASKRTGRRIHMHLFETRYQRAWCERAYPQGTVRFLDSIGFLSPRLTLAHCIWTTQEDRALLAERGVTIASNHSSNLHLRSGLSPAGAYAAIGGNVALGLDATALDEDDDALREMRLARLLQHGNGFDLKTTPRQILGMAFDGGHLSVMNEQRDGSLAPGKAADILVLDWSRIDEEKLRADVDPVELLLNRATARHIKELIVDGKTVVRDGAVPGVDYPAARREVLAKMREGLASTKLAPALTALERVIENHYQDTPCC